MNAKCKKTFSHFHSSFSGFYIQITDKIRNTDKEQQLAAVFLYAPRTTTSCSKKIGYPSQTLISHHQQHNNTINNQ